MVHPDWLPIEVFQTLSFPGKRIQQGLPTILEKFASTENLIIFKTALNFLDIVMKDHSETYQTSYLALMAWVASKIKEVCPNAILILVGPQPIATGHTMFIKSLRLAKRFDSELFRQFTLFGNGVYFMSMSALLPSLPNARPMEHFTGIHLSAWGRVQLTYKLIATVIDVLTAVTAQSGHHAVSVWLAKSSSNLHTTASTAADPTVEPPLSAASAASVTAHASAEQPEHEPKPPRPSLIERLKNEFEVELAPQHNTSVPVIQVPATKRFSRKQWADIRDTVNQLGPEEMVVTSSETASQHADVAPLLERCQTLEQRCQHLEMEVRQLRGGQTTWEQRVTALEASLELLNQRFSYDQSQTEQLVGGMQQSLSNWLKGRSPNAGKQLTHPAITRTSFGSSVSSQKLLTSMLIMLMFFCNGVQGLAPLTFYDCGSARSSYPLIVPKMMHCQLPHSTAVFKTRVQVYTIRDKPIRLPAYHCHLREREICTYYSIAFGKGITKDKTTIRPILPLTCIHAVSTKFWGNQPLFAIQEGVWATQNHLQIAYSYCCFDNCMSVKNLVVEKGEIATLDGKNIMTNLGNLPGCQWPSTGYCQTPDGTVVWNASALSPICPYALKGTFDASLSHKHILIEDLQGAFTIDLDKPIFNSCLPDGSYYAEQGGVVLYLPDYQTRYGDIFRNVSATATSDNPAFKNSTAPGSTSEPDDYRGNVTIRDK